MKKIIIITGQTATGKTSYAIRLAKEKNGELVNFDSRQMYKYLTIITGKDTDKFSIFNFQFSKKNSNIGYYLINGIRIWLYDVVDPKNYFSSFDFKELASVVINDIQKRNKIPILVGGTYLYLKHLLFGFETENIPPDWELRKQLNPKSTSELFDILCSTNDQSIVRLNNSDRNNPRRLIRKIEVELFKKKSNITRVQLQSIEKGNMKFNLQKFIGLRFNNNERLSDQIKKRVKARIKSGAFEEVQDLLKQDYKKNDPGLLTIGYQQLIDYFEKRLTKKEAIDKWITAEIQYAKRQYTFMKKDENIDWQLV